MTTLRRSDHGAIGRGGTARALLHQAVKELPTQDRVAPVEAKSVLVEIGLELLSGRTAMESSEQPSLEQRSDTMNSGEFFVSGAGNSSMPIAIFGKPAIGPRAVTDDQRAFGNGILHEAHDGGAVVIGQLGEPNPTDSLAADFSSDYHDILCLPCWISRRQPADKSLVYLDIAGKLFASRANHSTTQFMQHRPCRLVTWQSEQSLKPHSVDTRFLVGYPPHSPKPEPQGDLAPMEYSSSRDGQVPMAVVATQSALLGAPCFARLAPGADKSIRPTNSLKEIPT